MAMAVSAVAAVAAMETTKGNSCDEGNGGVNRGGKGDGGGNGCSEAAADSIRLVLILAGSLFYGTVTFRKFTSV